MKSVILCIDFESYLVAVASCETLTEQVTKPENKARLTAAAEDLKRAYLNFLTIESYTTPALLRRQAE